MLQAGKLAGIVSAFTPVILSPSTAAMLPPQAGEAGGNSYGIHTAAWSTSITVNSGSVNATSGEAQGDSCGIFAESRDYDRYPQQFLDHRRQLLPPRAVMLSGRGWYSCGIRVEGHYHHQRRHCQCHGQKIHKPLTSCGIYAVRSVKISGGTVTATGGTSDKEYSSGIYVRRILAVYNVEVTIEWRYRYGHRRCS